MNDFPYHNFSNSSIMRFMITIKSNINVLIYQENDNLIIKGLKDFKFYHYVIKIFIFNQILI